MNCLCQEHTLGYPLAVLSGHTSGITRVVFSPIVPQVLLSSSYDGTLRIWHASHGGSPAAVLYSGSKFGTSATSDDPAAGSSEPDTAPQVRHLTLCFCPSLVIYDTLAAHPQRRLEEALSTAPSAKMARSLLQAANVMCTFGPGKFLK
jgi:hypothetical protein